MSATLQLVFDLCQFRPHAFLDRSAPDPESPGRHPRADMHKAQGVECLWFTQTPPPPIDGGTPPKLANLRRELLDRILVVNECHLRRILTICLHHFNTARLHRTLGQLTPAQAETQPPPVINLTDYQVPRRAILDGLTSECQIAA
ncbi:MAG: hypothetical protein JO287_02785 [Pseudonocardiales bacterium]|nr:hypothetical protein [Pseudonocardiales bacterium]